MNEITGLKKFWDKLKGKKRNIGILLMILLRATSAFFPEALTPEQIAVLNNVVDVVLLGGFVDAVGRSNTSKQIISKSKNIAGNARKLFNQNNNKNE